MKADRLERIAQHGRNLLAIFPKAQEQDPVALCKKLRALERRANAVALRLCNGPEYPGGYDEVDNITDGILAKVNRLLGNYEYNDRKRVRVAAVPIFLNRDPRGNALKIDDTWIRANMHDGYRGFNLASLTRDWGGYGIIAPEIE